MNNSVILFFRHMQNLTIVKVGGAVVEDESSLKNLIQHFSAISGPKILVHGGGKLATKVGDKLGIKSKYVNGRRVTDEETLEVVTMVYGGLVNKQVVAKLQAAGCNACGLSGADANIIKAHKRIVKDVDYGYAGDIDEINATILKGFLDLNIVPVLAPLTHNAEGLMLNTNADTIASETAIALSTYFNVRLVFCFDKQGVLADADDDSSVISNIDKESYASYKQKGIISGGMIPKLDNAFSAINKGVNEILLTNTSGVKSGDGTLIQ